MKKPTDIPIYSIVILSSIGFFMLLRLHKLGFLTFGQFLFGCLGMAVGLGISHGIIGILNERRNRNGK